MTTPQQGDGEPSGDVRAEDEREGWSGLGLAIMATAVIVIAAVGLSFLTDLNNVIIVLGFLLTASGIVLPLYLAGRTRRPTPAERRPLTVAGILVAVLLAARVTVAALSQEPDGTANPGTSAPPDAGPAVSSQKPKTSDGPAGPSGVTPSPTQPIAAASDFCPQLRAYEDATIGVQGGIGSGRLTKADVQPVVEALTALESSAPPALQADTRTLLRVWTELRDRLTEDRLTNSVLIFSTVSSPASIGASDRIGQFERQQCPR